MKRIGYLLILLMTCGSSAAADPPGLADRLKEALFVRTAPDGEKFGNSELDILVWDDSRYLLTSPLREKAIQVLDDPPHLRTAPDAVQPLLGSVVEARDSEGQQLDGRSGGRFMIICCTHSKAQLLPVDMIMIIEH